MKLFFGVISIVLGIGAAYPYIRSIYKGKTVPHRVSWLIWLLLAVIIFVTQLQEGARWSLLLTVASIINDTIIFLLSLRHGTGGFTKQDRAAFLLALIGIGLWAATHASLYGLAFAIFADSIGVFLTTRKAWLHPGSESAAAWFITFVAAACAVLAIHSYIPGQTIFPVYAVVSSGIMALTALVRRPQLKTVSASR